MQTQHTVKVTLTAMIEKRMVKIDMRCKSGAKLSKDKHLFVQVEIGYKTVFSYCLSMEEEMSRAVSVGDSIVSDLRSFGIDYSRADAVAFATREFREFREGQKIA